MNAFRRLRTLPLRSSRRFSCSPAVASGHNRWSKIRHDKAKTDANIGKQRNALVADLQVAVKVGGPEVQSNIRLANVLARAKKEGLPKQTVEDAIKRAQGISPSGKPLESLMIEAMIPPGIAVILECQTDAKLKLLNDIKSALKYSEGGLTSVTHLFNRTGKVVLENTRGLTETDVFDCAIDAGATDVSIDDDGNIVILTDPGDQAAAARTLADQMHLKAISVDVGWEPREEMMVDVEDPEILQHFITRMEGEPSIHQIYVNAR